MDLFNPKTWRNLDQRMIDAKLDRFSLITINPVGGWPANEPDPKLKWSSDKLFAGAQYVLLNAVQRLARNGHLYMSVYILAKSADFKLAQKKTQQMAHDIATQYGVNVHWSLSEFGSLQIAIVP